MKIAVLHKSAADGLAIPRSSLPVLLSPNEGITGDNALSLSKRTISDNALSLKVPAVPARSRCLVLRRHPDGFPKAAAARGNGRPPACAAGPASAGSRPSVQAAGRTGPKRELPERTPEQRGERLIRMIESLVV